MTNTISNNAATEEGKKEPTNFMPTISDVAKRLDPKGKIVGLIELMNKMNPILEDAVFIEANSKTSNKTTIRTGLPEVAWRMYNQGIQPSKSISTQVTDTCGMLEAYAEIDAALADLHSNAQAWRLSEEIAFIEAMNQELASTLFYGNIEEEPKKFMGLAPRYNALSGYEASKNVLDFGGKGNANSSIWLCGWGNNTLHCFYPEGSEAGLKTTDKGVDTVIDADGGRFEGLRSHYKWDVGLSLRDWRYCVRIANIDMSKLSPTIPEVSNSSLLLRLMIAAAAKIPNTNSTKLVWYMNAEVKTMLDIIALEKSNVHLTIDNFEGKPVTSFLGIPIRKVDALLNTEEALV